MTTRHFTGLALLTLATLPAVSATVDAQTVEGAPTNCCTEIYWAGWELGRLRSIVSYPTAAYRQDAGLHMQRLSQTLQAANESCCRFCEAWVDFQQIQDGIRETTSELLDPTRSDAEEARRAFREWVERRPVQLVEGLNRCDLDDGMPCKWLDLVECARAYFQLGAQLGHAMHAFPAAGAGVEAGLVQPTGARQDVLDSLEKASGLMSALTASDHAPGSPAPPIRCSYLWQAETGAAPMFSEVLREPDVHSGAQLAAEAAEAHGLVLRLLIEGRPDLGIPPCPIGAAHDHLECELAEEHGHLVPATDGD